MCKFVGFIVQTKRRQSKAATSVTNVLRITENIPEKNSPKDRFCHVSVTLTAGGFPHFASFAHSALFFVNTSDKVFYIPCRLGFIVTECTDLQV